MEKFASLGWMLVVVCALAVSIEAVPAYHHNYLGYVSPNSFLSGYNAPNYFYQPYRARREAMGYDNMHDMHDNMPYGYSSFNPFYSSFGMFNRPFRFPYMGGFNYDSMPYNPMMVFSPAPAAKPMAHPYGNSFMKMMGFHGDDHHAAAAPAHAAHGHAMGHGPAHGPAHPAPAHGGNGYNNYNAPHGNNAHPKDKGHAMFYSKSYSVNMDYTDGKGTMMTKGGSYMNDNGKVKMQKDPERHYTFGADGKPVLVKGHH